MTLVELMVAGGILAGLSAAGMQMYKNQSSAQKTVEANYEIAAITQQMRTIIGTERNCSKAFEKELPEGGISDRLWAEQKPSGSGVWIEKYVVGDKLPGNIKILNYTLFRGGVPNGVQETYMKVDFSRGLATIKEESSKMLKMGYTLDPATNKIKTCWGITGGSNDSFWLQDPAFEPSIYYPLGNVGIGKGYSNPKYLLDVNNFEPNLADPTGPKTMRVRSTHPEGATIFFQHDPSYGDQRHYEVGINKPGGDLGEFVIRRILNFDARTYHRPAFKIRSNNTPALYPSALNNENPTGIAVSDFLLGTLTSPPGTAVNENYRPPSFVNTSSVNEPIGVASPLWFGKGARMKFNEALTFEEQSLNGEMSMVTQPAGKPFLMKTTKDLGVKMDLGPVANFNFSGLGNFGIGTQDEEPKTKLVIYDPEQSGDQKKQTISFGSRPGYDYSIYRDMNDGNLVFQGNQGAKSKRMLDLGLPAVEYNGYVFKGNDLKFTTTRGSLHQFGPFAVETVEPAGRNFASFFANNNGIVLQNGAEVVPDLDRLAPIQTPYEHVKIFGWKHKKDPSGVITGGEATDLLLISSQREFPNLFLSRSFKNGINTMKSDSALSIISPYNGSDSEPLQRIRIGSDIENASYTLGRNPNSGIFEFKGNQPLPNRGYSFDTDITVKGINVASDLRLKRDIRKIASSPQLVEKLRGVLFTWRDSASVDYGFIAQEVAKVAPELVTYNKTTGMMAVKYANITAILVESQKLLMEEDRKLKEENAKLKREVSSLKRLVCLDHPTDPYCAGK